MRDHDKPIDVSKASAKIALLTGNQKQEVELQPKGESFVANGTFKIEAGTKALAQVNINGKTTTFRFVLK